MKTKEYIQALSLTGPAHGARHNGQRNEGWKCEMYEPLACQASTAHNLTMISFCSKRGSLKLANWFAQLDVLDQLPMQVIVCALNRGQPQGDFLGLLYWDMGERQKEGT